MADIYTITLPNGGTYSFRDSRADSGTGDGVLYGTCSTAAATAAKVVVCADFALNTGASVAIRFNNGNTAAGMTLNVNNTGAVSALYNGSAIGPGTIEAGGTYLFVYDGTNYNFVGSAGSVSAASASVTIAVSDWSNNACTKSVAGVTATNNVVVSYAPASKDAYTAADIYCSAQGAGTLTFTCEETPSESITVNVLIITGGN